MIENKINLFQFPNIGVLFYQFTDDELNPLKNEIDEIQLNFNKFVPFNKNLAGNLEKEFELIKSKNYIDKLIQPFIEKHTNLFNYVDKCNYLNENKLFILDKLWVNFQKKYEFNPNHNHSGIYSFVIWLNIPYNIEDEMKISSSINSNTNRPGYFNFLYTNSLGNICSYSIPADKKYKNVMCLFPASMIHSVNPFFTSDDYRITVSGNFSFNVSKE